MMMQTTRSDQTERQMTDSCPIAEPLSRRLMEARAGLTLRWLERISDRVDVAEKEVFPTRDLLDHVPLLVEAIAGYMADPAEEGVAADRVIGKAAELGRMRFEQGFSPYQILKEFEILGSIMLSFLTREADELALQSSAGELLVCAHRLHHALALVQQATAARYLTLLDAVASEREQRLRSVNQLVQGPVSEGVGQASELLRQVRDASDEERDRLLRDASQTLERVRGQMERLRELSGLPASSRMQRNVPLESVIAEATRLVRELAEQRGVEIRVARPLPDVDVYAAGIELCLIAFLTNAVKHAGSDEDDERWVEISAQVGGPGPWRRLVVRVRDNGGVIPPEERERLLRPMQVETVTEKEQPGLGLNLVREAVEALGGRTWIESAEDPPGSVFCFELPSRRRDDSDEEEPADDAGVDAGTERERPLDARP